MSADGISVINRGYQFRFVSRFCGSVLLSAAFFMVVFYWWTNEECGISYYETLSTLNGLRQNILPVMVMTGFMVTILISGAVLAITLFSSHKIAGPIYRLEQSLKSIGDGDLTIRIRFRPYDAVNGLSDEINFLASHLNNKMTGIKESLNEIRKEAHEMKKNSQQSPSILLEKIRVAKKAISDFKTE